MRRALAAVLACALAGPAAAVGEGDRDARRLLEQACLMCHSEEMVAQQRLTRAQWDKVLAKMEKWGPPFQEGELPMLAAYLARTRGPDAPAPAPASMSVSTVDGLLRPEQVAADAPAAVARGELLYKLNCASCHGDDARGKLAQSLIGRPVITRPADWHAVLKTGRRRMPEGGTLSERDRADVLAWVRTVSRREETR